MSDLFLPSTVVASGRAFGSPCHEFDPTPAGYYPPLGSMTTDAQGVVYYTKPGNVPPNAPPGGTVVTGPTPGFTGNAWNYALLRQYVAGTRNPAGFYDSARTAVNNSTYQCFVGDGKATIYAWASIGGGAAAPPSYYDAYLYWLDRGSPGWRSETIGTHISAGPGTSYATLEVDCSHALDAYRCVQWIYLTNFTASDGSWNNGVGFDGVDWAPLDTGGAVVTGSVTMPHAI
jgi:hypothetical protein